MKVEPKAESTTVPIHDGQTIVLGGLTQDKPEKEREQVPALGKIPILGRLFRSHPKESEKKELMIFVTPTVVQPSDDQS